MQIDAVWCCTVWCGDVRLSAVGSGLVLLGVAWCGMVRLFNNKSSILKKVGDLFFYIKNKYYICLDISI